MSKDKLAKLNAEIEEKYSNLVLDLSIKDLEKLFENIKVNK